ncbi:MULTISPECIES: Phage head morphogenesis protein, SPP1 gp7 [Enterobacteriaceae]|uniref:Phage head morphogenesis protein, SPP1 gp7 n=1 Tax=Enterobacteriaceae TaxID=543 RepID=UPI000272B072|nr:Phage head morphogenesis protein, SPP1 gp7 [Enterobacter sp. Ag1]EJF31707.1 Phage head morphogenesis protein, SPP1 gp7 [Enterobacter sp. Ag1]
MNDSVFDNAVMVQSMLERLKAGQSAGSRDIGIEIRRAVALALADFSGSISSKSRAEMIAKALKRELKPVLDNHASLLLDAADKTSLQMAELEYLSFVQVFGDEVVKKAGEDALRKSMRNSPMSLKNWNGPLYLPEFIEAWGVMASTQVTNEVVRTFSDNGTVSDLQQSINGSHSDAGAYAVVSKIVLDYDAISRTALQHAHSMSAVEFYMENPDIVDEEEFAAILDNKTSTLCRSLDGTTYPVGKGPRPPLHIRCRSRMLPVINKRFRSMLKQDAPGDSVYGEETYYQWLERQSVKRQDIILGPTRGKLFRDGGLTPDQFAKLQLHKNFKPMTLEDMKKAAPDAFERAGLN